MVLLSSRQAARTRAPTRAFHANNHSPSKNKHEHANNFCSRFLARCYQTELKLYLQLFAKKRRLLFQSRTRALSFFNKLENALASKVIYVIIYCRPSSNHRDMELCTKRLSKSAGSHIFSICAGFIRAMKINPANFTLKLVLLIKKTNKNYVNI